MQVPDDPQQHGWAAIWLTAALAAFGVAWKSWFGIRKDSRDDRGGSIAAKAYEEIIVQLRTSLADEIVRRKEAEDRLALLEARVRELETQVRQLQRA